MYKITMNRAEFNRAVKTTRLKTRAVEMARDVLCNKLSSKAAAEKHSLSPQAARAAAARVTRAYRDLGGYPNHWFTLTVTVPPAMAHDIRDMAIEAICREHRIRVKQKDIPQELAREAVDLLGDALKYWKRGVSIAATSNIHREAKALLYKLEESEQ